MDKREFNNNLRELSKILDNQREELLEISDREENLENERIADTLKILAEKCERDKEILKNISTRIRKGNFDESDRKTLIQILEYNPVKELLEQ